MTPMSINLSTNDASALSDLSAVATEVAWVIGTLMCDAGTASHPSTTLACPLLLPALARVLVSGGNGSGVRPELKRECLAALWNTVSEPPSPQLHQDTTNVRDEMLLELYRTVGLVQSLLATVPSHDIDAMQPALSIVDAMHRRLGRYDGNFRTVFEEGDCGDLLEGVCDRASSAASYGSGQEWSSAKDGGGGGQVMEQCAEMAANLIDDYYADDNDYPDDNDGGMSMHRFGDDGGGILMQGFGDGGGGLTVPSTMPHFSFGHGIGRGDKPQSAPFGSSSTGEMNSSLGRGRGRGSTIPAWMQQNH